MSKYYTIRYFGKKRTVFPPVGYTPARYIQTGIIELAEKGVLPGWSADNGNTIGPSTKDQLKGLDGKIIDIPKRWGLAEKTWISEGLMARLDELWPLIDMHNVHKITYHDSAGERKVDYANSREVITSITEELSPGIWQCELITVENEGELKKLQGGDDGYERIIRGAIGDGKILAFRHDDGNGGSAKEDGDDGNGGSAKEGGDDSNGGSAKEGGDDGNDDSAEEVGDDGWCGKELLLKLTEALQQARSGQRRTGKSITEDAGTKQVEDAVTDTMEDTVEDTVKERIEDGSEGKVEDKVEGPAEGTEEDTAEDPVQGTVEDAAAPSKELSECKIT